MELILGSVILYNSKKKDANEKIGGLFKQVIRPLF